MRKRQREPVAGEKRSPRALGGEVRRAAPRPSLGAEVPDACGSHLVGASGYRGLGIGSWRIRTKRNGWVEAGNFTAIRWL